MMKQLTTRDLAASAEVRIGKRNLLLIEVLGAGANFLGKRHTPIPGRGKLPHRTYAAWLMMLAEKKRIRAALEYNVPGTSHPVDVAYEEPDGRRHAFEVIANREGCNNIADHLRACLLDSDRISRVTIVVPLLSLQTEVAAVIEADRTLAPVRDRIDFLTLITCL